MDEQRNDAESAGRPFQFQLRHLFFASTAVAIVCGLGKWVGWEMVMPNHFHVVGPSVTLVHWMYANGQRPVLSVALGALSQGALFGLASVAFRVGWGLWPEVRSVLADQQLSIVLGTPLSCFTQGAVHGALLSVLFVMGYGLLCGDHARGASDS